MNYYVWYRVERDDRDTETAIRSMMSRVGCRAGVHGQLLKKRGEPQVWMEIYEAVSDAAGFERILNEKADEFDVGMFIDGARHLECFDNCFDMAGMIAPACNVKPLS